MVNRLPLAQRVRVLSALVEGSSIRATTRMTGTAKGTILKLVGDLGAACKDYQDKALRNLPCRRIQVDEIWAFCYAKRGNVPSEKKGLFGYGDVWTWTSICTETKVIPHWLVATRGTTSAKIFMKELSARLSNRVQLSSDAHKPYLTAVPDAFGDEVDYGQIVKSYSRDSSIPRGQFAPLVCSGTARTQVIGRPRQEHISTSYVERANLTMRMCMRRFTRLTNAFSKKIENLVHAVAIYFMYYNFGRIHQSLRITPAMAAGTANHVWSLEEILGLIE